ALYHRSLRFDEPTQATLGLLTQRTGGFLVNARGALARNHGKRIARPQTVGAKHQLLPRFKTPRHAGDFR
ncbi:MAG TPA: hypothetical protein VEK74_00645, partial [Burkholderiaceae bacterium]|nr:hypothetical protein [Burkholderiaceae bacterium]